MSAEFTGTEIDFGKYCRAAVKRFLRTAVVIDDDAELLPATDEYPKNQSIEAPPFAVVPEDMETPTRDIDTEASKGPATTPSSEISMKSLTDAFLDRQIVCGVLKPVKSDKEDAVIHRAVEASTVADILIIDWYLRPGDSQLVIRILTEILKRDRLLKGRLRLAVVYTSASPLEDRCTELKNALNSEGFDALASNDNVVLEVENCRIRFVQKSFGATGTSVEELPALAVEEFSKHAKGLLPSFALLGIAALREATHHLLTVFSSRYDPAFVGHRMLLTDPRDAHGFAMKLLMLQIQGILSLPHRLGNSLGDNEIGDWFDNRFDGMDEKLKALQVNRRELRTSILNGGSTQPKLHTALFLPDTDGEASDREAEVSADFARLATFVREFNGFNPLPQGWKPTLTLGTVVKRTDDGKDRYFLCVQPACDTVRIKQPRHFPFVELKVDGKSGDAAIILDGERRLKLRAEGDAGSRHYDRFSGNAETLTVIANQVDENGVLLGFVFTSEEGANYTWIGDIDFAKAQRIAVELAMGLARVGIDEYEWLRRGGRSKG